MTSAAADLDAMLQCNSSVWLALIITISHIGSTVVVRFVVKYIACYLYNVVMKALRPSNSSVIPSLSDVVPKFLFSLCSPDILRCIPEVYTILRVMG